MRNQEGKGIYDRFRHRLMFPIRNRRGQVVGFGGRLIEEAANQPKYLNSPETQVFHKGTELYGLHEIKQPQKLDFALVVEGYMDVLSLSELGCCYAVASLGTAMTVQQAKILFRETNTVIICFDGDSAGHAAAMRALKTIFPLLDGYKELKFLTLPTQEDPDSYIQKNGKTKFEEQINGATSAPDFLLEQLVKDKNFSQAGDIANIVEQLKDFLKGIAYNAYVAMIIHKLSNEIGMTEQALERLLLSDEAKLSTDGKNKKSINGVKTRPLQNMTLVEKALAFLLIHPHIVSVILSGNLQLMAFEPVTQHYQILWVALKFIAKSEDKVTTALLLYKLEQHYPDFTEYFKQLASMALFDSDDNAFLQNEGYALLSKVVQTIKELTLEQLIGKSKSNILTAEEKQQLQTLLASKATNLPLTS